MVVRAANVVEIPNWATSFVSARECDEIESAVRRAELKTAGEIVPMLVHCCFHLKVPRRILFLSLLLMIAIGLNVFETVISIDFYSTQGVFMELVLGLVAAAIAFLLPIPAMLLKALVSKQDMQRLVESQAELEFYRQGINGTDRNSGVLLFVSLTERRAVVLADKLIAAKLPPSTWDEVLATLLKGIRSGNAGQGFVDAIDQSSKILAQHFPRQDDDKDELSNRLVFR
jgi:putative membrane protein